MRLHRVQASYGLNPVLGLILLKRTCKWVQAYFEMFKDLRGREDKVPKVVVAFLCYRICLLNALLPEERAKVITR